MGVFENAYLTIDNLRAEIPSMAREALLEHKEFILDILRYDQLGEGVGPEGIPLAFFDERDQSSGTGFYTEETAEIAANMGTVMPKIEGEPYNFQWTGDTFRQMDMEINESSFEIFSRTGKYQALLTMYGDVFYLSEFQNKMININVILPFIKDKIFETLGNLS